MKAYFDNAATTPLRSEVIEEMTRIMAEHFGNPSSTHSFGRSAKSVVENVRKEIAALFNVSTAEIFFTSGGTESDNFILNCCVRDLGVRRIISSPLEHHAVLHTIEELVDKSGITAEYVKVKNCGTIDYGHLESLLKEGSEKTLVSLMHVNNEIGNLLDIERVADLCKEHGALFHSDTVQSVGHLALDLGKVPVDFAVGAAHKFHGPKGMGFAFIRKNTGLRPFIFGGGQERGLRAGTESVHNIAGMGVALKLAYENLAEESAYICGLKDYFREQAEKHIPGVKFNGKCAENDCSAYTLLNICLPISPEKAALLNFQLDLKGVACSKGSACQSGSDQRSHVLSAILDDEDLKKPSLRFSFSKFNTKGEIDYAIAVLKEFVG